jgi:hypothetical protein
MIETMSQHENNDASTLLCIDCGKEVSELAFPEGSVPERCVCGGEIRYLFWATQALELARSKQLQEVIWEMLNRAGLRHLAQRDREARLRQKSFFESLQQFCARIDHLQSRWMRPTLDQARLAHARTITANVLDPKEAWSRLAEANLTPRGQRLFEGDDVAQAHPYTLAGCLLFAAAPAPVCEAEELLQRLGLAEGERLWSDMVTDGGSKRVPLFPELWKQRIGPESRMFGDVTLALLGGHNDDLRALPADDPAVRLAALLETGFALDGRLDEGRHTAVLLYDPAALEASPASI